MKLNNRKTRNGSLLAIISIGMIVCFQNCSENKISFLESASTDPLSKYELDNSGTYQTFLNFNRTKVSDVIQENLGLNKNSLKFRIDSANPISVNDLKFFENNIQIKNYIIDSKAENTDKLGNIDIALVIDDTGSMGSTIESVKLRLTNFVNQVYDRGSNARFCITTFGDQTNKRCNKFYNINSADSSSIEQKKQLLSELTSIRASGGGDAPENPLRAILDTLEADWISTNQQFLILITDVNFHHAGSPGQAGALAPNYADVITALNARKINIFAATPTAAGYNSAFSGYPSIVTATDGEWFLFRDLVNGTINFDTILDRIINRVNSYYTISFTSEENAGLDPQLPVSNRNIRIDISSDSTAKVLNSQLSSSLPEGRKEYKKDFSFTNLAFDPSSLEVAINRVPTSGYTISRTGVSFNTAPPADARIIFSYKLVNLEDGVTLQPIVFADKLDPKSVYVTVNGQRLVENNHYKLEKSIEGRYSLLLQDSVFENSDPFQIEQNRGIKLVVKYLYDTASEVTEAK